jgi:Tfp pilus assembly protein PilW
MEDTHMPKSIIVATSRPQHNLKQAQALLAGVLKQAGHPGCLSGFDIHFIDEVTLYAHNAQVTPAQVHSIEG